MKGGEGEGEKKTKKVKVNDRRRNKKKQKNAGKKQKNAGRITEGGGEKFSKDQRRQKEHENTHLGVLDGLLLDLGLLALTVPP